jgi:hypothetical protein
VARGFGRRRWEPARQLEGAGRFSDDGWLDDPRFILAVVQHTKALRALQKAEASLASRYGRPRLPGSYLQLYVAFCIDRDPDVESFYNRHRSSDIWTRCGFARRPSLSTLYARFDELADKRIDQAIQDAIAGLIKTARKHAPEIGRHVHIDGTLAASHARLRHVCDLADRSTGLGCGGREPHPLPARMSEAEAIERHHAEDEAAFDDEHEATGQEADAPTASNTTSTSAAGRLITLDAAGLRRWGLDPHDPGVRRQRWFERDGHLLACRDGEAGVRTYSPRGGRGRTTIGMNHLVVTDHATGGLLAFSVVPADRNEFTVAASLMDQTRDVVGLHPQAMVADRGFHITSVFNELHDRQIAYVGPWRKAKHQRTRATAAAASGGRVDRHGVIRCSACGGPTQAHGAHLGVTSSRDRTAIRVQCAIQPLPECAGTQTVRPEVAPRLIGPLNRTDRVYWQLRHTHSNYERSHAERLARYTVGGRDTASRTKRLGIGAQHVRLRYAQLLDWLRICLRYGWVKPPRGQRNVRRHAVTWRETPGAWRVQPVLDIRAAEGLDIPDRASEQLDAQHAARQADAARASGNRAAPPPRTA